MKIIFLASGEFALPTLEWVTSSGHETAAVISQPPREKGRGRKVTPTPVHQWAREHGLHVLTFEDVNDPEAVSTIAGFGADLGIVIAFGQKLGKTLLTSTRYGFVNLHASILPKFRGAAPINWAILRGEARTGVTVFRINERMDAGRILTQEAMEIRKGETADELHDRLAGIGVAAVRSALEMFRDDEAPEGTAQAEAEASKAPKLSKADGVIDFTKPPSEVVRHILGLWSWPGASTVFEAKDGRWESVVIARAREAGDHDGGRRGPGELDDRLFAATKEGFVELLEIKPASGPLMAWRDYVNGRHVQAGDRFTRPR